MKINNMKLIEITKQILNEAAPKNPLSLFRSIFKAAGINFAEVEAALLLGLKQIDPKIVSLTSATPEQIEKAFKTTTFRKYSQTIARNYIANNDKIIDGILKKYPTNTTQGSKAARLEIANTLSVNKSIADDIFVIKKPKKINVKPSAPNQTPPTTSTPTIVNPYDALKPVVIDQKVKDAFVKIMNERGIKIKPQHLDNVMLEIQKSVDNEMGKLENLFSDPTFVKTITSYNKLPIEKQNDIVLKAIEIVKKTYGDYLLGLKVSNKTKNNLKSMWDHSVDAYYLGVKKRGEKFDMGKFIKWWVLSTKVTWGLFFASIYVEGMRKEDEGTMTTFNWIWQKVKEAPMRFLISLVPGVNLISSSGSLLYQTITSAIVISYRKLNPNTVDPNDPEGLLNNEPTNSNTQEDPAGIIK